MWYGSLYCRLFEDDGHLLGDVLFGIRRYLTKKVCNRKYSLKFNFIFIPNWSAYATILYLEVNVNVF